MTFPISKQMHEKLYLDGKFFVNDITHDVIHSLTSWIVQNLPAKKEFTIVINSSGGTPSAISMFASFLATLDKKVKIKGVAFGECGSAALALLQCCHQRIAVKHCAFFIHHINIKLDRSCHDFDTDKFERQLAESRALEAELNALQYRRCGMSHEDWTKLADDGERIPGLAILEKEALRINLVDKYVDHYQIF